MAKAAPGKAHLTSEKPSEVTIPEAPEEQKAQLVVETQQDADSKAEEAATDKTHTEPEVVDTEPEGDAAVAEVTAEVADLKVSEPVELETTTAQTTTENVPVETQEAELTHTFAEAKGTPEISAQSSDHEAAATNNGSADAKDEDETW